MKKYLTALLLFAGYIGFVHGQNLVPNPSFENNVACPMLLGMVPLPGNPSATVSNWFIPSCGSSDYFNTCSTIACGIPNNTFGYQHARTGNGYMGGYMLFNFQGGCREYIQALLNSTMIAGHEYYVSFWVCLADWQPNNLSAVNTIGAYLGTGYINNSSAVQIDFVTPQIINPGNYIGDTLNWTRISGTFIANGTENCIVLGNFISFASQTAQIITGSAAANIPYYYFDDICVVDMAPNTHSYDTSFCGLSNGFLEGRSSMQSFLWSTGDTSLSVNITQPGTYWVKSFGECEAWIDTFHVMATGDTIKPDLGNDTSLCFGQTMELDAANSAFLHYNWSTGDTTASIVVTTSGTYSVTAESYCGTFTDSISVTIKPEVPPPPALDTLICTGTGTAIPLPYDQDGLTWHLSPGDTGTLELPVIDASRPGNYHFYVTQTIAGCTGEMAIVTVTVKAAPLPAALPADTALCAGERIILGQPLEDMRYLWSTGDTVCCIAADTSGTYHLKVYNECGAYDTESDITFSDCNRCIWAGNAFSPNADGHNDRFEVKELCPFKKYSLHIYNRYGQVVFHTDNVNDRWEGTFHNQPCDAGVYYYYLEAEPEQAKVPKIKMKGDITLIR